MDSSSQFAITTSSSPLRSSYKRQSTMSTKLNASINMEQTQANEDEITSEMDAFEPVLTAVIGNDVNSNEVNGADVNASELNGSVVGKAHGDAVANDNTIEAGRNVIVTPVNGRAGGVNGRPAVERLMLLVYFENRNGLRLSTDQVRAYISHNVSSEVAAAIRSVRDVGRGFFSLLFSDANTREAALSSEVPELGIRGRFFKWPGNYSPSGRAWKPRMLELPELPDEYLLHLDEVASMIEGATFLGSIEDEGEVDRRRMVVMTADELPSSLSLPLCLGAVRQQSVVEETEASKTKKRSLHLQLDAAPPKKLRA